jgi:hypothetical protein
MKIKFIAFLFMLVFVPPLLAQNKVTDCVTSGSETYSIINISRSFTYQERDTWFYKFAPTVFINDKPVCELLCGSRVSIKVYSEGNLKLTLNLLPFKKFPQEEIDKFYHQGPFLELNVANGNTYYLNVDTKEIVGMGINLNYQLVKIPESEGMFKEEKRFKKNPEINLFEYRL